MIIYTRNNKRIYLSESKLRDIITKSVNSVLTEAPFYRRKKQDPVYFSMDDEIKLSEDPLARVEKEKQSGKPRNFAIERNGKQYWVARSSTISLYVFCKDENGEWNVLVSQRGKNMQYGGKWNVVAGFLDYGETLETAAVRECYEECGVNIKGSKIINCGTSSDDLYGAVNHKFACILDGVTTQYPPSMEQCEGYGTDMQEVQNVAWVPVSTVNKLDMRYSQKQNAKELISRLAKDGDNNTASYREVLEKLHGMATSGELPVEKYNQIINILKN